MKKKKEEQAENEVTVQSPDPGPMARFEHVIAQPETFEVIVCRVAEGETLRDIAKAWRIPFGRLFDWCVEPARAEKFIRALQAAGLEHGQEAVAVARTAPAAKNVPGVKVLVDTLRWSASRLAPDHFGEHKRVDVKVNDERTPMDREMLVLETARNLGFILATADAVKREQLERKQDADNTVLTLPPPEPEPDKGTDDEGII